VTFQIPEAIEKTTEALVDLELCAARLQLDARYPWIVLVPRREGLVEIEELSAPERAVLMEEAILAGEAVRAMGEAIGRPIKKLNIASLGNITSSLHLHVLGRREDDFSWPSPVWGSGEPLPWPQEALALARLAALRVLQAPGSRSGA